LPGPATVVVLFAATAAAAACAHPQPPPAAALLAQAPATAAPRSMNDMSADELILQFKHPELQAALRQAAPGTAAQQAVVRALDALGQRQGVRLRYLQTLGVGSALVAVTPASPRLDALVARLAADPEVESVEVNARMTTMRPGPR
jgi:hypothetical protein